MKRRTPSAIVNGDVGKGFLHHDQGSRERDRGFKHFNSFFRSHGLKWWVAAAAARSFFVMVKVRENKTRFQAFQFLLSFQGLQWFVTGYLFIVSKGSRNSLAQKKKFGIIIDGGSTSTRIHMFKLLINEEGVPIYDFGKEGLSSLRVNPSLSSYLADPESTGDSLLELMEFAREKIPQDYWEDTEIRLMATAGLRRVDVNVQERILVSCRRVLSSSGFKFQSDWASIIAGSNEDICLSCNKLCSWHSWR